MSIVGRRKLPLNGPPHSGWMSNFQVVANGSCFCLYHMSQYGECFFDDERAVNGENQRKLSAGRPSYFIWPMETFTSYERMEAIWPGKQQIAAWQNRLVWECRENS